MTSDRDDTTGVSVFQQLIDIYVSPEIQRRRAAGGLPEGFQLNAAQVVCFADGESDQIRLNDEVRATALVRKKPEVAKEVGDAVFLNEIEGVETIVLPETEDKNCGHATMIRLGDHWYVVLDFRYNRGRSLALLERARQFLAVAQHAQSSASWSAFAYNLFTAMELAAKAELLVVPDEALLTSKTHGIVHARLNRWAKLGNVELEHASVFNALAQLRPKAVYSLEAFELTEDRAAQLAAAVIQFVDRVRARAELSRRPRASESDPHARAGRG